MSKKKKHHLTPEEKPQIKDRRMRIIWSSNSPWANSGYSTETRDILFRLLKDGWPVAAIGWAGLTGSSIGINGLTVYPAMQDVWGNDALINHSKHWKANVAFTMQDVPMLQPQALQEMIAMKIPWIPYCPLDQEPVPPPVLDRLRFAHKIISFSRFGQKALQNKGFYSKLILEGTDTNIFQPRDKKEARTKLGWPQEKFIFGMIGANKENPPRKGWQEGLEAFSLFVKNHPDSFLYIHSNQWFPTGFPIIEYINYLGIKDKIIQMNQYLATYHTGSIEIAMIMNGLDCLLQPSMTEGFGLPIIEAGASGIPVIVNDCTSMPELIIEGKTGEKCKASKRIFSSQGGYIYFADVDSLYEKMELVLKNTPNFYRDTAREHILENYNIDTLVKDQWIPYLENLQNELLGPNPLTQKLNDVKVGVTE